MPRRKKNGGKGLFRALTVDEDVRMAVNLKLKDFRNNEDEKEYEFPSSLTSEERAYIHRMAIEMGLKSKSRGKGATRYLTVYKRDGSTIMQSDAGLNLTGAAKKIANNLLNMYPVTNKERQELLPPTDRERNPYTINDSRDMSRAMGKLNSGIPQVPPYSNPTPETLATRSNLPIWAQRHEILSTISQNQVTLITGDTGSGKTTQVPQFILEDAFEGRKPCRVVCTQPRRLAAVSVAERVASEREEKVGQTVGFQIRLESRVSPKTLLSFCTNGVLLRTLMGGDAVLGTLTHIVIDEVHERDRFSDFLLTVIRDALSRYKDLKLVMMSATVDTQLFLNYFSSAKHIAVPGRCFPVREVFLEDILLGINYSTPAMDKLKRQNKGQNMARAQALETITKNLTISESANQQPQPSIAPSVPVDEDYDPLRIRDGDIVIEGQDLEPVVINLSVDQKIAADKILADVFLAGGPETFQALTNLVSQENYPVDYQHSATGVSALMAAAGTGQIAVLEQLLAAGADVDLKAANNWNASDFATCQNQQAAYDILESYKQTLEAVGSDAFNTVIESDLSRDITEEQRTILNIYHGTFSDEKVDHNLVLAVIKSIQEQNADTRGAVLVFLPGYDDIVIMKDLLKDSEDLLILQLHSQMGSIDQKKVFRPAPHGMRKVILSTNIAETSLTIDDVVYVVDAGKVKENTYDALTGISMLKMVWASKTSATQRKGRAGRCQPGVAYRLFSRVRYENMPDFQTPEILRTPLMELCLHTKLLASSTTPIADFLARTPQPPSFLVTRNAVQALKTMEALDAWEDVTELGNHLLDLPVEPRLGKMVLYAVVLKCLDPILTIVCCSAYRDPFLLSTDPARKRAAKAARKRFAAGTFSDHMALLRAFQGWQAARADNYERSFCSRHQISASTMEMITGMRTQLLGQLRASGFVRAKGSGDIRDLNKNSENWAVVKAALAAGSYPYLARYDREAGQLRSSKESKVKFHPSSVLLDSPDNPNGEARGGKKADKMPTDWYVFDEMTRAGHLALIRGVTAVSPLTVLVFAGPNRLPIETVSEADAGVQGNKYLEETSDSEVEEKVEGENTTLRVDEWVVFRSDAELAHLALQLRQKWSALFLRRLHAPGKPMTQVDNAVIDALVNILSAEEQAAKLTQPMGIGQRPRPINSETLCSSPGSNDSTPVHQPHPHQLHHRGSSGSFSGNLPPQGGGGGGGGRRGGGGGYRGQMPNNYYNQYQRPPTSSYR